MRTNVRQLLCLVWLVTVPKLAMAQDTAQVVRRLTMAGAGYASQLDTYISPEDYGGADVTLLTQSEYVKEGRRWSRMATHQANFWWGSYRSGNGSEISGDYTFSYTWLRQWVSAPLGNGRLSVKAGPAAWARAGFLYNTRNSNNPAQAKLALGCAPAGVAEWTFKAGRRPCLLRCELTVPLLGLMFTPQYGQSYYEIFSRGNYDHNLVVTTPVNSSSASMRLLFGMKWKRLYWTAGLQGDCLQAKVNHLKYHRYNALFLFGVSKQLRLL